jgi:hypothetical protein
MTSAAGGHVHDLIVDSAPSARKPQATAQRHGATPVVQLARPVDLAVGPRWVRDLGTRRWRTVVVDAITSLPFELARPARLADLLRGHWRSRTACTGSGT